MNYTTHSRSHVAQIDASRTIAVTSLGLMTHNGRGAEPTFGVDLRHSGMRSSFEISETEFDTLTALFRSIPRSTKKHKPEIVTIDEDQIDGLFRRLMEDQATKPEATVADAAADIIDTTKERLVLVSYTQKNGKKAYVTSFTVDTLNLSTLRGTGYGGVWSTASRKEGANTFHAAVAAKRIAEIKENINARDSDNVYLSLAVEEIEDEISPAGDAVADLRGRLVRVLYKSSTLNEYVKTFSHDHHHPHEIPIWSTGIYDCTGSVENAALFTQGDAEEKIAKVKEHWNKTGKGYLGLSLEIEHTGDDLVIVRSTYAIDNMGAVTKFRKGGCWSISRQVDDSDAMVLKRSEAEKAVAALNDPSAAKIEFAPKSVATKWRDRQEVVIDTSGGNGQEFISAFEGSRSGGPLCHILTVARENAAVFTLAEAKEKLSKLYVPNPAYAVIVPAVAA